MRKGLYVYPWDLEEEGTADVAARLRDTGLDSISLAVSYHAGKFVRPHAPRHKVYFPEDGVVYFRPDATRYGAIKPLVGALAEAFDALGELSNAAGDFAVTAWTVGLHNTPLGRAQPAFVVRNAFGDPLWNALCPAHPEVRAYLVALCADIAANQPVAEVAIETPGWQAYRHGHHHEFELIALGPRAQILLGMCFCDACVAGAGAAGIDAAALAARTRSELERFFADGTEPTTDPAEDPHWRAFTSWRIDTVTALVAEVRAAMTPAVGLAVIPTTQSPNSLCWIEGSDLGRLAAVARLEIPAYQTGLSAIARDVDEVRTAAGGSAGIGYILRPDPGFASADELREVVEMVAATGPQSISFYNYGHLRLGSLDWIKAAIS